MAYVKTTWATGDVITAEKLNNAENQIENLTPYIITPTASAGTITLNLTWQEIKDLLDAGQTLVVKAPPYYIQEAVENEGMYGVGIYAPYIDNGHLEEIKYYLTDSPSGYPSLALT